jgi:hypothetical protein
MGVVAQFKLNGDQQRKVEPQKAKSVTPPNGKNGNGHHLISPKELQKA